MRFPRNAKIFRGQMDFAPLAGVFFLLVVFVLLGSLIYTPGIPITKRIHVPTASNFSAPGLSTVIVSVGLGGQLFYRNKILRSDELENELRAEVQKSKDPIALMLVVDEAVANGLVVRLRDLALRAGITEIWQEVRPPAAIRKPAM
jgi:biopolymer transport protein ExbD